MILYENTVVKYRDGTVKTLDEVGGEAKELAADVPVKNGSTSKPLDEFIQDQIVLAPETPVVDGEDVTTLEEFVEENAGSKIITAIIPYRNEDFTIDLTGISSFFIMYQAGGIDVAKMLYYFRGDSATGANWKYFDLVDKTMDQPNPTTGNFILKFSEDGNTLTPYNDNSSNYKGKMVLIPIVN